MAYSDPERNVQQCLLDRLIDLKPDDTTDKPVSRSESLHQLRASVKRDLEWLLNTNRTAEQTPEAYRELRDSLYFYGLPDITSIALDNSGDEQRLLRSLEDAITKFEPRLTRVRVLAYETITKKKQAIQFYVEALLMVDPAPERISFDTVLDITKGAYRVKEDQ